MSRKTSVYYQYFILTFCCFLISALSVAAIPFMQYLSEPGQKIATYIIAFLFWVGIILGIVSTRLTNNNLRRMRMKVYESGQMERPKLPGILMFSLKPVNIILYVIIAAGLCLIVSDIIFHFVSEFIMFPVVSITLFAFVMHCVIDGKNYRAYRIIKEGMHNDYNK